RGGAGRGHASRDAPGGEPVAERGEPGNVLADREHVRGGIGGLREVDVWLEMLGDVDDAAAVHAGVEADAPAPQRVDENGVAALGLREHGGPRFCPISLLECCCHVRPLPKMKKASRFREAFQTSLLVCEWCAAILPAASAPSQ